MADLQRPAASDDSRARELAAESQSDRPRAAQPDCDPEAAIARLGGFVDLYRPLVASLLGDLSGSLAQLRAAVQRVDPAAVHFAAHSFKGLAVTCGANRIAKEASTLEAMGRAGNLQESQAALAALDRSMEDARAVFASYLKDSGKPPAK